MRYKTTDAQMTPFLALILSCLMWAGSSAAFAAPTKSKADALAALAPHQRAVFEQIAEDEFCGCDSPLTLQGCLKERPQCRLASDLGQTLARLLAAGAPKNAAQAFMSQHILGPYCSLPATIDTSGAPTEGSKKPEIEVVEFFDYRCTHCRAAQPSIHQALKVYGKRVRLTSMPLALVENSVSADAAEAALAAAAQGKFRPMHQALFAQEDHNFSRENLRALATKVGLNVKAFDKAMDSHTYAKDVKAFLKRFIGLGLDGTPAFFVGGRRFDLEPTLFSLEDRLAMEFHRDQTKCR